MEIQPEVARHNGKIARMAGWAASHRKSVLALWVAALVVAMGASSAAGPKYVNNLSLAGTDSQHATELLAREFPAESGDADQIVLHARSGRVTDPAVQRQVAPVLESIAHLPHVTGVLSPFTAQGAREISSDGRTAFATVTFDQRADALRKPPSNASSLSLAARAQTRYRSSSAAARSRRQTGLHSAPPQRSGW